MKTKLIALTYRRTASVDPRFSAAMLPWTINDIRSIETYNRLSVGIENGLLEAYNSDFELQFSHQLKYVVGMCRIIQKHGRNNYIQVKNSSLNHHSHNNHNHNHNHHHHNHQHQQHQNIKGEQNQQYSTNNYGLNKTNNGYKMDNNFMEFNGPITGMVYLLKDPRDPLLHIHLYESESIDEMTELMQQMRDPIHTLGGSVGSIPQTLVGSSNSNSDLTLQKALRGNGIHSTPASNLKLTEALRVAQHDSSPTIINSKMSSSKSYTHGLSNSAGTVNNIPTSTSASANLALLNDISPNHSHFFEVMYVGKIRVSHKRVPFTFIDDAIPKFKAYDAQRSRIIQIADAANRRGSLVSQESEDGSTCDNISTKDDENNDDDDNDNNNNNENDDDGDNEHHHNKNEIDSGIDKKSNNDNDNIGTKKFDKFDKNELKIIEDTDRERKSDESSDERQQQQPFKSRIESTLINNKENHFPKKLLRGQSQLVLPVKKPDGTTQIQPLVPSPIKNIEAIPRQRDRSASYGCIPLVEQNRTMVFLVGRSDLRLISPDRKQVLLYKDFKDVASCAQGHKNADHFGIICREGNNEGYIGYVFKCQSDHVADDIVAAISQAFITCSEQKNKEKNQIFSCEHCPMLWYHKLCSDIEGLSDKKTQSLIFRRIESLTDDEQDTIWAKYYGAEKMNSHSLAEQNQFLMMLLRAHCESRQQRHVHDTAENRSEFLNQYLGGSTIFMKAKRSLTSSFDHLLKRKGSKDDFSHNICDMHIKECPSESSNSGGEGTTESSTKSRSSILTSPKPSQEQQLKSPMMDIFIKVGNSPKEDQTHQGSWRQAILNSVVTPNKNMENGVESEFLSPMRITQQKVGKRTKEELRELWKTAIRQTILLSRMEKENARLQARQNENEMKKIKLDYDEISPCDRQAVERWEIIIERDSTKIGNKKDPKVLLQAIKNGVPRSKRGEVWAFLAEQHSMNTAPVDTKKFPNFNTPYQTLLKNLTEHQHAIFIDLGRTFPNHKFYKQPLGVGQLSLFNLLKAYSILDPELGYCQGLGFICGILLLHCDEEEAFHLLKHLMFRRQMRTKYLPDMQKFQLQLYQLSRLVKDYLPDLYTWLDQNDVSPTLYAAPWILTVFSSQFPLGFVARIFDLLFLESSEVIFKVAISLLTVHKDELLSKDNFEDIMDYLKNTVPKINTETMDKVMKSVFSMDISKQLIEYQVEYNVLQEEITTTNHHLESLNKERERNHHLETQLQFAQSSIAQLEKTRSSQQTQITTLQSQVQSLEVTIQTLGRFISQVIERNRDIELPTDVRRIIQQLDDIEKQRKKPLFIERKIGKSLSVNSHLGFPLKVLEELNERENNGTGTIGGNDNISPNKKSKTPFFESTYEQLRQQRASQQRPNRLVDISSSLSSSTTTSMETNNKPIVKINESTENIEKISNIQIIKSPTEVDSGFGTPLSPSSEIQINNKLSNSDENVSNQNLNHHHQQQRQQQQQQQQTGKIEDELKKPFNESMHPLSMCGDVNFRFNGTTQLKSIKPTHSRLSTPRHSTADIETTLNNSNINEKS